MTTSENTSQIGRLTLPRSLDEIDQTLSSVHKGGPLIVDIETSELNKIGKEPLLESSTIQWLSTLWSAARSDSFEISNLGQDIKLAHLSTSAPGAVLALLPHGKLKNVTRRAAATFKDQFFEHQNSWPDLALSNSAFILCLDSYSENGLPFHFYSNKSSGELETWDGFRLFVDKLILSVAEESKIRGDIQTRTNNLSTILFELFKNTHDHARINIDGAVINDSVRGIYSRFYPIRDVVDNIKPDSEKNNALENYLGTMLKPMLDKQRGTVKRDLSGFLELSVFDTGPGMAARWLGGDISGCNAKEQYEAVINCLRKGNSSTPTSTRGFGLWRVLQELIQVKGFIRIRTNRVHVFRQYAMLEKLHMERQADGRATPKEIFFDWRKQYTSSLSDYPPVKGTIISIVVPLGVL